MPPELGRGYTSWARSELARCEVRTVAEMLARRGVSVMPMKGVELVHRFSAPAERLQHADVDLLVEPGFFDAARETLANAGYRNNPGWSSCLLLGPNSSIAVDLHRLPLPLMMGRFSPRKLFANARVDGAAYGVPVHHMNRADFFVHLACNHLKDRLSPTKSSMAGADLVSVGDGLAPASVRSSAVTAGLLTATWLTVDWLARSQPQLEAFAQALVPDQLERLRGRMLQRVLVRLPRGRSELGLALARSAADSWLAGACSAILSGARVSRDRLRSGSSSSSQQPGRPSATRENDGVREGEWNEP